MESIETIGLGESAKFHGERGPEPWKLTELWVATWGGTLFKSVCGKKKKKSVCGRCRVPQVFIGHVSWTA